MTWNSTFTKPAKPLQRKTPMKAGKPMGRGRMRRSAKSHGPTATEHRFLDAIAAQGCILCRRLGYPGTPAEIHHLRAGMGAGQRNDNQTVIPLCPEHHRGNAGYHGMGRRAFERTYGVTELDLLREAWEVMDAGRADRISHNTWSTADELEYHQVIQPLAHMVHGEDQ